MNQESGASERCRAVFFDRDGVVNRVLLKDGQPFSPRKPEEFTFTERILEAVTLLKRNGYKVILISNQPELARGLITQDALDEMMRRVKQEIGFDDIFLCLHDDHHHCACRKPRPGMILDAAEKWKIDLGSSYVIGDTWRDMEAGRAAGCKTILVDAVYNRDARSDVRVESLFEAVGIILR